MTANEFNNKIDEIKKWEEKIKTKVIKMWNK